MITLTKEEREKFADYLNEQVLNSRRTIEQLKKENPDSFMARQFLIGIQAFKFVIEQLECTDGLEDLLEDLSS